MSACQPTVLLCCKMHISKKFVHKSKKARKARLDIVAIHDPDQIKKLSAFIQSTSSSPDKSSSKYWSKVQISIYQSPLCSIGKKNYTNKDWFQENINVLLPLIKVKPPAHAEYQHEPSSISLNRSHKARKIFWSTARKCSNKFWLKTITSILSCCW